MESVLVIDHDPATIAVISTALEATNEFAVIPASTKEQAVAQFRTHEPGIVIVDFTVDRCGGVSLARWLRQADPNLILFLHAANNDVEPAVIEDVNPDFFLEKPFSVEEFQEDLEKARRVTPKAQ